MVVDVELWTILAGMIALIFCGCIYTRPATKPLRRHDSFADMFDEKVDRVT